MFWGKPDEISGEIPSKIPEKITVGTSGETLKENNGRGCVLKVY